MTAKKRITIEYLTHLKDTGIPALATAECMLLDQPGLRNTSGTPFVRLRRPNRASNELLISLKRWGPNEYSHQRPHRRHHRLDSAGVAGICREEVKQWTN